MKQPSDAPAWWRLVAAFLLAPAVPALVYAAIRPSYDGAPNLEEGIWQTFMIVAAAVSYPTAWLLGGPLAFLLRRRMRLTLWNCVQAGIGLAAVPWSSFVLLPRATEAELGGQSSLLYGHITWHSLYEAARALGEIGFWGVAGGASFWLIAAAGHYSSDPRRARRIAASRNGALSKNAA